MLVTSCYNRTNWIAITVLLRVFRLRLKEVGA